MATIGLIELPALKLLDKNGFNWTAFRRDDPLGGKQVLSGLLESGGHEVTLVNLKDGNVETEFGQVEWNGLALTKTLVGDPIAELDPERAELWGVTVNYLQEREVARDVVRVLAKAGKRVVVGGSDAIAEPDYYLQAGAAAVVLDKSGAANLPLVDSLLGRDPREPLSGVALPSGVRLPNRRPPLSSADWPLPSTANARATLGTAYWEAPLPESLIPIGAVMLDLGCDRKCDFCQTPTYGVGYTAMSPERVRSWLELQKRAGAKSVIVLSDQFLGRVLWPSGRDDVLAIMRAFRELGLAVLWGNGLEVNKATLGRGKRAGDPSPDEELVQALWGWDGASGCAQTYIPAERPINGPAAYEKLLSWRHHVAMMEAIVKSGVPDITYGVIVGLPGDSAPQLADLLKNLHELRQRLKQLNAFLRFRVVPYAIRPLPGTPQARELDDLGLVRFRDPAIAGGFWTACADTHHMTYSEVSEWQHRIIVELSDNEPGFQGITALA